MTERSDTQGVQCSPVPKQTAFRILLADDDVDDCLLFNDALDELGILFELTCVHNGDQLMKLLNTAQQLPDVLFLDLNMPKKNGAQCLSAIKESSLLKSLCVIIISTSFDQQIVDILYENGANYYLRKPNDFSKLKKMIENAIALISQKKYHQPSVKEYVLSY